MPANGIFASAATIPRPPSLLWEAKKKKKELSQLLQSMLLM